MFLKFLVIYLGNYWYWAITIHAAAVTMGSVLLVVALAYLGQMVKFYTRMRTLLQTYF